MKTALVTGAGGFIGSHLTELLLEKGYRVKALVHYNSFNFWGWLEDIRNSSNLEVVTGDIRDAHYCKVLIRDVDIVFNLAALISIPYSYISPEGYFDTNIKGALNICQAAKDAGGIRVIHTSTSEVYGTAQYVPIDEKHPKQPQSPYSASKIGADAVALSFYNSFDLPVTILRPFNTYGPRQSARAIIPSLITQILSGATEIKIGDLRPTRDLNFVKDTCSGFLAVAENKSTIGKELNLASNQEISMADLLKKIQEIMKSNIQVISDSKRIRPDNSEVFRLLGDNSLLSELTGFKPQTDLTTGLRITCEWYSNIENSKKYKTDIYNL